jgi:hypothetical protein
MVKAADALSKSGDQCRVSDGAPRHHRTVRAKGCLSNKTALAMIFKLAEAAEKSWRRLDGHNLLPKLMDKRPMLLSIQPASPATAPSAMTRVRRRRQ